MVDLALLIAMVPELVDREVLSVLKPPLLQILVKLRQKEEMLWGIQVWLEPVVVVGLHFFRRDRLLKVIPMRVVVGISQYPSQTTGLMIWLLIGHWMKMHLHQRR